MEFSKLANQYRREAAVRYNQVRVVDDKWDAENRAFEALLSGIPEGARTLDIPVGTGRLFDFYLSRQFRGTGLDISPDMLEIAKSRAAAMEIHVDLALADIREIPFEDRHFDLAMSVRFLNWVDIDGVRQAISELSRVSREYVMIGIRHISPLDEFRFNPTDIKRFLRLKLGVARRRANRAGLVYHRRSELEVIFRDLALQVVEVRNIERRRDGTVYNVYMLRKAD